MVSTTQITPKVYLQQSITSTQHNQQEDKETEFTTSYGFKSVNEQIAKSESTDHIVKKEYEINSNTIQQQKIDATFSKNSRVDSNFKDISPQKSEKYISEMKSTNAWGNIKVECSYISMGQSIVVQKGSKSKGVYTSDITECTFVAIYNDNEMQVTHAQGGDITGNYQVYMAHEDTTRSFYQRLEEYSKTDKLKSYKAIIYSRNNIDEEFPDVAVWDATRKLKELGMPERNILGIIATKNNNINEYHGYQSIGIRFSPDGGCEYTEIDNNFSAVNPQKC